jgi:hypothetical protein
MKALQAALLSFWVVILMAVFALPGNADVSDKLTIITFNQPVEIPGGKVLPAGTYAFKLLDSPGDRNIVQIFDKDQMKLYGTVMAIPDYRPNPSDKTIITFAETAAGGPPAIKEWFYPGDQYGQEFVYPKNRAVELAKQANQPVPSAPTETASNMNQPVQSSDQNVKAMEDSSLKAEEPSGQEVEVAEVFIVHAPAADQGTKTVAQKLPQTASSLPLLCAFGVFLLALGGLLWTVARRLS